MKYAYILQLSNILVFWTMLAMCCIAANGSSSRAALARYTQSDTFGVMLFVVSFMVPLLQYGFGPTPLEIAHALTPSLGGAYMAFIVGTLLLSVALVALFAGHGFRMLMAELFAPAAAKEPEHQVSTAK